MTLSRINTNKLNPYNVGIIGWDVATAVTGDGNITLTWPAMPGAVGYSVQANGLAPINVGNVLTGTITGLTAGQSYTVSVVGYDSSGNFSGCSSPKVITAAVFNLASGGTEATITNYNGTGQSWKTHTFTSSGTLTVTRGPNNFSTLIVAGGTTGTTTGYYGPRSANGGNGASILTSTTATLSVGAQTVTVGAGGGNNSALGSYSSSSGTVTGGGGTGFVLYSAGGTGGAGLTSTITGTSTVYGGGGGGGGGCEYFSGGNGGSGGGGRGGNGGDFNANNCQGGTAGTANTGGGGGGAGSMGDRNFNWNIPNTPGGTGGSGVVIVAYRVA